MQAHLMPRAVLLAATLAACEGAPVPGDCVDIAACSGGFTLSKDMVTFSMKQHRQPPPPQLIRLHITGDAAVTVEAAYVAPERDPGWLDIMITGTAPDLVVAVGLTAAPLLPGQQSAELTLRMLDANHHMLQARTVLVRLIVASSIEITTPSVEHDFPLGSSTSSATMNLDIAADSTTRWRITASESWIIVPDNPGTGGRSASVTLDAEERGLGQYTGSITVASTTDPADFARIPVTMNVLAPVLDVSSEVLRFGGDDGLEATGAQPLDISLATGTNAYPWSATSTTDDEVPWLDVSVGSGSVAAARVSIDVSVDRARVSPGRHVGAVRIEATIAGARVSRRVSVTVSKEGHWLHAAALGVAFSSFPGRSVVTRTLEVRSSRGRADVPWTAVSDQPWLSVTPAGVTGGGVTLTASPSGLELDHEYLANVTISSPDSEILNTQRVRVGLRVGATDPHDVEIDETFQHVVTNPVEPYVYATAGGRDIAVYDVYSGALVRTFRSAVAGAGRLAVSSDGTTLFVDDESNLRAVALDAETGIERQRYPWGTSLGGGIAYARPSAQPILLLGFGKTYDVATAEAYAAWAPATEVDAFSEHTYAQSPIGFSPSTLVRYTSAYTTLDGDRLSLRPDGTTSVFVGGGDLCVSSDGARVYTRGESGGFSVLDAGDLHRIQALPGPQLANNAACGWNGLFFGGEDNVLVYRPDGTLVSSFAINSGATRPLIRDSLMLSGDNTRVMASVNEFISFVSSFHIRSVPPP